MGPIAFDQGHDGRVKKCSEKRLTCNESEANTNGCCSIVACRYCVTWEEYGEDPVSDMTDNGDGTWTATPGGVTFVMYWERDQYTDECELVVTFDGEEVYRKSCYEGQSCRDSSDTVEVDLQYLDGTLTWAKDLKRPLPNVRDYETNCIRQMCTDCNCTCECLCVTITEYDGTPVATGEICDTAYDCDPPIWDGTVGEYEVSIALDEDCVLTATVDGYAESIELEAYTSVCDNFTATITLDDGKIITVTCKECSCNPSLCTDGCCPGVPLEDGTFTPTECGPGTLGCPDIPVLTGSPCLAGLDDIAPCSIPEELEAEFGGLACGAFCVSNQNITGSLGAYDFDVVLGCVGDGTAGRAFIRYTGVIAPPGIDLNTWVETDGGFECPDCTGANAGTTQDVVMWYDVYVNCGICNATDIVYGPPDVCTPDSLYSVRVYYQGSVVCPLAISP